MVNAHMIIGSSGCILVDAGTPGSESKIGKVLRRHGMSFKDIKLIVITHAHVDHAGSAATLRELSGAPIVGHKDDLKYYKREMPMTFCPTGWAGRLFLKTPVVHEPYQAFEPDILLTNGDILNLSKYGIPALIKHTPGHTAGSISVELNTKEALVGDLIASGILIGGLIRTGCAIRPPFEDDPRAVGIELQRLLDSGIEKFYMGHGGPLAACEVQRHARDLLAMK
jgi:glyoxylase-like metal-dependent hydrolase (beta-lactamase superfamily II)